MKLCVLTIVSCVSFLSMPLAYHYGYYRGHDAAKIAYIQWKDACRTTNESWAKICKSKDVRIERLLTELEARDYALETEFNRAKEFILSDMERQLLPRIEKSIESPIVKICTVHDSCVVSTIKNADGQYEVCHTEFK